MMHYWNNYLDLNTIASVSLPVGTNTDNQLADEKERPPKGLGTPNHGQLYAIYPYLFEIL